MVESEEKHNDDSNESDGQASVRQPAVSKQPAFADQMPDPTSVAHVEELTAQVSSAEHHRTGAPSTESEAVETSAPEDVSQQEQSAQKGTAPAVRPVIPRGMPNPFERKAVKSSQAQDARASEKIEQTQASEVVVSQPVVEPPAVPEANASVAPSLPEPSAPEPAAGAQPVPVVKQVPVEPRSAGAQPAVEAQPVPIVPDTAASQPAVDLKPLPVVPEPASEPVVEAQPVSEEPEPVAPEPVVEAQPDPEEPEPVAPEPVVEAQPDPEEPEPVAPEPVVEAQPDLEEPEPVVEAQPDSEESEPVAPELVVEAQPDPEEPEPVASEPVVEAQPDPEEPEPVAPDPSVEAQPDLKEPEPVDSESVVEPQPLETKGPESRLDRIVGPEETKEDSESQDAQEKPQATSSLLSDDLENLSPEEVEALRLLSLNMVQPGASPVEAEEENTTEKPGEVADSKDPDTDSSAVNKKDAKYFTRFAAQIARDAEKQSEQDNAVPASRSDEKSEPEPTGSPDSMPVEADKGEAGGETQKPLRRVKKPVKKAEDEGDSDEMQGMVKRRRGQRKKSKKAQEESLPKGNSVIKILERNPLGMTLPEMAGGTRKLKRIRTLRPMLAEAIKKGEVMPVSQRSGHTVYRLVKFISNR